MRAAGGSEIINIGAVYSRYPDPAFFATSVNRAAGNSFTKTLALKVAKDNILVNGVNIGFVITPQWENIHRRRAPDVPRWRQFFETFARQEVPLGRFQDAGRGLGARRVPAQRPGGTSRARRSTSPAAWAATSQALSCCSPRPLSGTIRQFA